MKGRVAYPFLTLRDADIQIGKWQIFLSDKGPLSEDDHIPNWDYAATIRIQRRLELDLDQAAQRLAIPSEFLKLDTVVRICSGPGTIPRTLIRCTQPVTTRFIEIDHSFKSDLLSRRLKLFTEIVLSDGADACSSLSPKQPGSRLWSDAFDFRLEGLEPRFPMEALHFSTEFKDKIESGALWYLHWNPLELDRDFHGGVRIYINADQPEYVDRVRTGDRTTIQSLLGGVISQMAERILSEPSSEEILHGATPGSIAWHVRTWLVGAFPNVPFELIRTTLEQRPGVFHSTLQGLADVVGDQP